MIELQIGDGVMLSSFTRLEAVGTIVDFVYVATAAPDERSQVRVYWRGSGGVSDHPPGDLVLVTPAGLGRNLPRESGMDQEEQIRRLRETVFAMINSLGAAMPRTPELQRAIDDLVESAIESASE